MSHSDSRIIKFHSEQALAAFILLLPRSVTFQVEEEPTRPGHYTMYLD